ARRRQLIRTRLSNRALLFLFFFSYTAPPTTEIYTLSLHDALPISPDQREGSRGGGVRRVGPPPAPGGPVLRALDGPARAAPRDRSEEHTSELQSRGHLVCRLLLEKKKKKKK